MARPRKITDKQILKAAQAVFLAKGFGVATSEIASEAGISEGSIFKRFATKEDLFVAAMGMSIMPEWISFLEVNAGQGDLKENLKVSGLQIMAFFQEMLPKMMMLRAKGLPMPNIMKLNPSIAPPVRILKALTSFFEKEIAAKRIRESDPQTLSMMFMGSLMQYVFINQVFDLQSETEDYVESVVELLWQSITPKE